MANNTRRRSKDIGKFPAQATIKVWKKGKRTGFTIDLELFGGGHLHEINFKNGKDLEAFLDKDKEDDD